MTKDKSRWNEKYLQGEHTSCDPSSLLVSVVPLLPKRGRTLDVAGGTGRHSLWLADRGLTVTLVDISDVALDIAQQRAKLAGLTILTREIDFERESFPKGPWELIVSVHYLWRPLFTEFAKELSTSGTLVFLQPTHKNLERHPKPPSRFLLADGELPDLVRGLDIIHYEEGWLAEGRHEALVVARRSH